jgi:hypothetical protein
VKNSEQHLAKMIIRGTVAEAEIETEFSESLNQLKAMYESAKAKGEKSEGAFMLALAYLGAEIQE